jgi:hypothetical protein
MYRSKLFENCSAALLHIVSRSRRPEIKKKFDPSGVLCAGSSGIFVLFGGIYFLFGGIFVLFGGIYFLFGGIFVLFGGIYVLFEVLFAIFRGKNYGAIFVFSVFFCIFWGRFQ